MSTMVSIMESTTLLAVTALFLSALGIVYAHWTWKKDQEKVKKVLGK